MLFAGMIFRYTEIAGLGRRVTERENRIEQLSAKRDALRQQIGTHTKKAYIEEIAKSELAMEYRDDVYTASIDSEPVANHSLTGKNPTLFGQLSVFVFGLLYR